MQPGKYGKEHADGYAERAHARDSIRGGKVEQVGAWEQLRASVTMSMNHSLLEPRELGAQWFVEVMQIPGRIVSYLKDETSETDKSFHHLAGKEKRDSALRSTWNRSEGRTSGES